MRLSLIVNPTAGKGKAKGTIGKALKALASSGIIPEVLTTTHSGHAFELAKNAIEDSDAIAGLGGDGTLNEIARVLMNTNVPMAVMPAGTGNDFIKSFAPGAGFKEMAKAIADNSTRTLDMGTVNGREFINVFGIGFDAVVSAENSRITSVGGIASYSLALLRSLGKYRRYPVQVIHDKGEIQTNAAFLTIGNGPVCGGGFRLTPEAVPHDRLLDVTIIGDVPLYRLLPHLGKAFNGRIGDYAHASMFRTKNIKARGLAGPLPCHLDGEIITPYSDTYTIGIIPGALRVFCP